MEEADRYRCRRLYLKPSEDPRLQAPAACEALANLEGILLAAPHSEFSVHIIYSLDHLSFEIVIDVLVELDFELDNSFLLSLRNTIFCYLEDNARDRLHIDETAESQEHPENSEKPHPDKDQYWEDYH
jgi:hypothetical protein